MTISYRLPVILCALAILLTIHTAHAAERFSVTASGQGPDVVLIPGLGCSADVWRDTVEQLESRYRLHVIQVAGFAGLPAEANAMGPVLEPLVDDIAHYAATLGTPVIVGHSVGGLIGLELAAKHPDALSRLLVVDALPFYSLILDPAATEDTVAPQARMIRDQITDQTDEQFELLQTMSMRVLMKSTVHRPEVLDWTLKSDRSVLARVMYEDMTMDVRPLLPRISAPVTILYAWDQAMGVPVRTVDQLYGTAYEELAGARLQRIDGSFHFIMFDQPQAFAAAIELFLAE